MEYTIETFDYSKNKLENPQVVAQYMIVGFDQFSILQFKTSDEDIGRIEGHNSDLIVEFDDWFMMISYDLEFKFVGNYSKEDDSFYLVFVVA